MKLEHIALWTRQLEILKDFYVRYFNGQANEKYVNASKGFESYFIRFGDGARLEIMYRPDIPENQNDRKQDQHLGLIHMAFGVDSMETVDQKASEFRSAGIQILSGPRMTGDGYYEFETLDPDGNRLELSAPGKPRVP
jgi:lactoylglutathione lyase